MLRRIVDDKSDRDFLVKSIDLAVAEVGSHVECETVSRCDQWLAFRNEIAHATVGVRFPGSDRIPSAIVRLPLEPDRYAGRRPADRNIQNMCCYSAHSDNSFLSLISVIFCCSSAAIMISVSRSFASRARQSSNISSAIFPVAQTMNMNPNFS